MGCGCGVTSGCFKKTKDPVRISNMKHKNGQHQEDSQFQVVHGDLVHDFNESEQGGVLDSPPAEETATRVAKWQEMATYRRGRFLCPPESPWQKQLLHPSRKASSQAETETETGIAEFAKISPEKFAKRLAKGPPAAYRWAAWKVALQVNAIRQPGLYEALKQEKASCPSLASIISDKARTFAAYPRFALKQDPSRAADLLENVLAAYANYNRRVGYCQGMNYLVAFLLLVSEGQEEDTFWAYVSLMQRKLPLDPMHMKGIEGLYSEYLPLLRLMFKLSDYMLETLNPALKEHFANIGYGNELWLQQWVSSLFLYSFPMEYCLRFWDLMLAMGTSYILPISYVTINAMSSKLLRMNMENCNMTLKSIERHPRKHLPSPDALVRQVLSLRLDWNQLRTTRHKYQSMIDLEDAYKRQENFRSAAESNLLQQEIAKSERNPQCDGHGNNEEQLSMEDLHNRQDSGDSAIDPPQTRAKGRRRNPKRRTASTCRHLPQSNEDLKLPPITKRAQYVFKFNSEILDEQLSPIPNEGLNCSFQTKAKQPHKRSRRAQPIINSLVLHNLNDGKEGQQQEKRPFADWVRLSQPKLDKSLTTVVPHTVGRPLSSNGNMRSCVLMHV